MQDGKKAGQTGWGKSKIARRDSGAQAGKEQGQMQDGKKAGQMGQKKSAVDIGQPGALRRENHSAKLQSSSSERAFGRLG